MKTVALVLAGGEGTRLHPLTAEHAKPALPFANGYRIVDFVLSNLVNSGIRNIYVLAQYKPESLMRHIETAWAPWFDGGDGLIKVLLPRSNTLGGSFKGTADAAFQYFDVLQAHAPDAVAVFAADHIYRMDVRQMAHFHAKRDADVTVAAVAVPIAQASAFGVMSTTPDGRVLEFREKPRQPLPIPGHPEHSYASMGNYLFHPDVLSIALRDARARGDTDFGRDVLPRLCQQARVYAYDFRQNVIPGVQEYEERAYWRDVGTLSALAAAQQDAMGHRPRFNLWNRRWPIRGEYDAALVARLRGWRDQLADAAMPEEAVVEEAATAGTRAELRPAAAAWLASGRDRHSDERALPS
jgi:glucose-1-phosphate adenylyltransferase